jgi:hypothetical protein
VFAGGRAVSSGESYRTVEQEALGCSADASPYTINTTNGGREEGIAGDDEVHRRWPFATAWYAWVAVVAGHKPHRGADQVDLTPTSP